MNSWACAARAAASISAGRRVRRPVRDVARDGLVEQHGLLRDDADLRAQRLQRDVADVDAVDADGAARSRRRTAAAGSRASSCPRRSARRWPRPRRPRPGTLTSRRIALARAGRRRRRRRSGTRSRGAAAGSVPAFGRSSTSECVSSTSKMRSDAAIDCWMLALTRLSFLTGVYIMNAATMKLVNCPVVSSLRRDLLAAVPDERDDRQPADQLHQRRQRRENAGDLEVGAVDLLRRALEARLLVRLGAERLDDPVPGERFGGDVGQVLELLLAAARSATGSVCPNRVSGYAARGAPVTATSASCQSSTKSQVAYPTSARLSRSRSPSVSETTCWT